MPYAVAHLRRIFTGKLGFELDPGRRHPMFALRHQGKIVAKTHISHGSKRDVSEGIIAAMARQLGVSAPQLRDAVDCRLSAEEFLKAILASTR